MLSYYMWPLKQLHLHWAKDLTVSFPGAHLEFGKRAMTKSQWKTKCSIYPGKKASGGFKSLVSLFLRIK